MRMLLLLQLSVATLSSRPNNGTSWTASEMASPAVTVAPARAHGGQHVDSLLAQLRALSSETDGAIAIAVHHVERNIGAAIHGTMPLPMASVFKLLLAVVAIRLAERRGLRLDSVVDVAPSSLRLGRSPIAEAYPRGGAKLSIRMLIEYMLVEGDNSAADLVLRLTGGPAAVTTELHGLGYAGEDEIRIDRSEGEIALAFAGAERGPSSSNWRLPELIRTIDAVPDEKRRSAGLRFLDDPRDRATAAGLARLLTELVQGRLLNRANTTWLLRTAERSVTSPDRIPALLPAGTPAAHRSGNGGEVDSTIAAVNDVGVITLPDSSHVVVAVLISRTHNSRAESGRLIARIARAAYDWASASSSATRAYFRSLDEQWLIQPYRDHDMRSFDRLLDERFRIVQSNGSIFSKAEKRADILASPVIGPDSPFAIADQDATVLHDVAISRGTIREMKSNVFYTNTYEHQPDGWHVVASQLTRVPR